MARANFGGGASDFLFSQTAGNLVRLGSGTLTLWDSESGGTRYTDLVVGGSSASEITVGSDGQIPTFQGPDEVYEMWADAGGGRVQLVATGDRVESAAALAQEARDGAGTARDAAAASADEAEIFAGLAGSLSGIWTVDPANPNILVVTPNGQVSIDPGNPNILNVVV